MSRQSEALKVPVRGQVPVPVPGQARVSVPAPGLEPVRVPVRALGLVPAWRRR
jgi:hypothetical protein